MSADTRNSIVLAVDLDGTLVSSDLFLESVLTLIRQSPLSLFSMLLWLMSGRAGFKQRVAERVSVEPTTLPYLAEVLQFVRAERASGRHTVLATGSDRKLVQPVADFLGCFDAVVASDGTHNRTGRSKARELSARYGEAGFDYIGNASVDLPVWRASRRALLAARSDRLCRRIRDRLPLQRVFKYPATGWSDWVQQLYLRRWVANILVFAPAVAAPRVLEQRAWLAAAVAFLALGVWSSAIFLCLDLLNLAQDRQRARQRERPLAAGRIYLVNAVLVAPLLLLAGVLLVLVLPVAFAPLLAGFCAVVFLAGLGGTARLPVMATLVALPALSFLAGGAAIGIPVAYWLALGPW